MSAIPGSTKEEGFLHLARLEDETTKVEETVTQSHAMVTQRVSCGGETKLSSKNYAPKVTFFGCGGFGINTIKDLPELLRYPSAVFKIIDTSEANTHRQTIDPCIEVRLLDEDGRGKIRGNKIEIDQSRVDTQISCEDDDSDLYVVKFALSGGSGSVLGPLTVKALFAKGKPIIVIAVADGNSTVDCINSINTLKSLHNPAVKEGAYVNIMLFDNTVNGSHAVDAAIRRKLKSLMTAVNLNQIIALDKNDINVAMRPYQHNVLKGAKGLFSMRIDDGYVCGDCYDEELVAICHSTITVDHVSQPAEKPKVMTSVNFSGQYVSPNKPMTLMFGLPISSLFNKKYQDLIKKYEAISAAHVPNTEIQIKNTKTHESGMEF